MADSKIKSLFIEGSYNDTTDNAGRVELPIPLDKLINVWVNDSYAVFARFLPANPQHCLVYVKGTDLWEAIKNKNLTFHYRYRP